MTKEAASATPSVPLHEVLEAEFAVLHGELPPDYPSSSDPNVRLIAIWGAVHELSEKARRALHFRRRDSQRDIWTGRFARPRALRFARQVPLSLHRLGRRVHRQLAERLD